MVASASDSSSNGTKPRGRRRVSRVNYAEDLFFDDTTVFSNGSNTSGSASKSIPEKLVTLVSKPTNSVTKKDLVDGSTGVNSEDVPLNWQPKQPDNAMLNIIDFTNAVVKTDGILYLRDGTTYSPEGT